MVDAALGAPDRRPHPRPWLAALLSFVFPGLGQAYAGRARVALLLSVPVALAVALALVLANGDAAVRNSLLSSSFLDAVIAANVGLFGWRAFAIGHAGLTSAPDAGSERRIGVISVAILLMLTVVMHVWVGVVAAHLDDTLTRVFSGTVIPAAPPPGTSGGTADEPVNRPDYRWDGTDRINVLLLGTDAHETRDTVLTDVILVVSIDPVSGTAVMISVPRDTGFVPLDDDSRFFGGLYPEKVNGLFATAATDPDSWCPDLAEDSEACGLRTIERSIGLYLGIEINHYAVVDMSGFATLIDALGGVRLCLPGELHDPQFDGTLANLGAGEPLILPAGCHDYNGLDALAYARSRKGWIELPDGTRQPQNDFSRNERQQAVLLALRDELADADLIFELPSVLTAIGRSVSTDFPRDQAGDLASLLPLIARPDIERVVLGSPEYVDLPAEPGVNYLLVPRRDAIREEMARLFGERELVGWYLGSTDDGPTGDPAASRP